MARHEITTEDLFPVAAGRVVGQKGSGNVVTGLYPQEKTIMSRLILRVPEPPVLGRNVKTRYRANPRFDIADPHKPSIGDVILESLKERPAPR